MKDRIVKITWEDAVTLTNESFEQVSKRQPELVDTYGVLVYKDKHSHIVMTHNSHGESNDYLKIPSSLVRKVEFLTFRK